MKVGCTYARPSASLQCEFEFIDIDFFLSNQYNLLRQSEFFNYLLSRDSKSNFLLCFISSFEIAFGHGSFTPRWMEPEESVLQHLETMERHKVKAGIVKTRRLGKVLPLAHFLASRQGLRERLPIYHLNYDALWFLLGQAFSYYVR